MLNPIAAVLQFEQAINSRDPDALCSLMAADGEFIDSLGNRIQGAEKLRAAWIGYFKMVTDYSISHSEIFAQGEFLNGTMLQRFPFAVNRALR